MFCSDFAPLSSLPCCYEERKLAEGAHAIHTFVSSRRAWSRCAAARRYWARPAAAWRGRRSIARVPFRARGAEPISTCGRLAATNKRNRKAVALSGRRRTRRLASGMKARRAETLLRLRSRQPDAEGRRQFNMSSSEARRRVPDVC
jgi:hypothetical protein